MNATIDQRTCLTVSPSVYARAFGEELVLLDFGKGEYFGLDVIGAVIWRALEAGDALGVIAETVAAKYEVGRDEALRDIVDLVVQLAENNLVIPVDSGEA